MRESKIGIVCFWDRMATPYLEKYERLLNEKGLDYDVIFWDRTGIADETDSPKEITIRFECRTGAAAKVLSFLKWRKMILRLLSQKKYDFLIILTTYPAVLLSSYLTENYKGRYIFDIRDYSMEANPLFGNIVTTLIERSAFTAISSKGYLRWLKHSNKIVLNHNITADAEDSAKEIRLHTAEKIRFTFVGNVRLDAQTKSVLLTLKDSTRYISGFVGRILPGCDIVSFCEKNNITNVSFTGPFAIEDKPEIYRNVDLINAIYANSDTNISLADSTPLPNRVYDAAVFKCPIVASKGTYLAELIEAYDLGFAVDGFDKDVEDQFDRYIENFDENRFREGCERFLKDIKAEESIYLKKLNETFDLLCRGETNADQF